MTKIDTFFRPKRLKDHALWSCMCLYSPYKEAPPSGLFPLTVSYRCVIDFVRPFFRFMSDGLSEKETSRSLLVFNNPFEPKDMLYITRRKWLQYLEFIPALVNIIPGKPLTSSQAANSARSLLFSYGTLFSSDAHSSSVKTTSSPTRPATSRLNISSHKHRHNMIFHCTMYQDQWDNGCRWS